VPRRDAVLTAVLLAVFAMMVAVAAGYPPEARLVPLVVGIPAVVLAAWQLARDMAAHQALGAGPAEPQPKTSSVPTAFVWLLAFALAVGAGGFVAGGGLVVAASQRFWFRESWPTALVSGGATAVGMHIFFERTLGLALFQGWFAWW